MFKRGQWVRHIRRDQLMRICRDQVAGQDQRLIWCEWMDGGYHIECHDQSEVEAVPRDRWPADEGRLDPIEPENAREANNAARPREERRAGNS
jgi:hypothetical protein